MTWKRANPLLLPLDWQTLEPIGECNDSCASDAA